MLKNAYFENTIKFASASEDPPPNPCLSPAAEGSSSRPLHCYYNFVEFVCNTERSLLP